MDPIPRIWKQMDMGSPVGKGKRKNRTSSKEHQGLQRLTRNCGKTIAKLWIPMIVPPAGFEPSYSTCSLISSISATLKLRTSNAVLSLCCSRVGGFHNAGVDIALEPIGRPVTVFLYGGPSGLRERDGPRARDG